jgi:teichoic acid transport system ATP-binding protein
MRTNLKVRGRYISKKFELSQNEKLKDLLNIGERNLEIKDFWALRNINFDVYDGETIGVVGLNGSGKSTLLNIINKSLSATTGRLKIHGNVSCIAIGAGLKGGLTGRDNIRLKGAMMGMSKKEVEEKMEEIIAFSELGPFIDRPVNDYSSGMKSKLSFSIAVTQDPDILIIDEALSVGDSTFSTKSAEKMFEFRKRGKTIFIVSHNVEQIIKWTDKVIWLHYGEVKEFGKTKDIIQKYQAFIKWFNTLSGEKQEQYNDARRKEQMDYSVDALKQEILVNDEKGRSQKAISLIDKTILQNQNPARLSWMSVFIISICVLSMSLMMVVTIKGGGISQNIYHSVNIDHPVNNEEVEDENNVHDKQNIDDIVTPSDEDEATSDTSMSAPEAPETIDYIVVMDDTISEIAESHGITTDDIAKWNPDIDISRIEIGMIVKLPTSSGTEPASTSDYLNNETRP